MFFIIIVRSRTTRSKPALSIPQQLQQSIPRTQRNDDIGRKKKGLGGSFKKGRRAGQGGGGGKKKKEPQNQSPSMGTSTESNSNGEETKTALESTLGPSRALESTTEERRPLEIRNPFASSFCDDSITSTTRSDWEQVSLHRPHFFSFFLMETKKKIFFRFSLQLID